MKNKMNQKLVNWTHWYEIVAGCAQKCIIIYHLSFPFSGVKIFCDDGNTAYVSQAFLIPMENEK